MTRRFRVPDPKPGQLLVKYGKMEVGSDVDLIYSHPENTCGMSRDSRLLSLAFEDTKLVTGKTLRQELEDRGYDITTLQFSVMKKNNQIL